MDRIRLLDLPLETCSAIRFCEKWNFWGDLCGAFGGIEAEFLRVSRLVRYYENAANRGWT